MPKLRLALLCLLSFAVFLPRGAHAASRWPSLQEQLARDRVSSGSALEGLIARNQDFSLLRDDEVEDRHGVPPWLKVLWRRTHPNGHYSAKDPTGGYPYVLKEIHEWLVTHQDLRPGLAEAPVTPGFRKLLIGANQRISGLQTKPRSESAIRIDPWDATKIIAASNNIVASGHQAQYYSTDGGTTWGQTTLPIHTGDTFHSDPTVEWTSDGTAWSVTIGIAVNLDGTIGNLELRSYKSADHGATWTYEATPSGSQTDTDKEMLWVDHSASSAFKDNVYLIWHDGFLAYMNRRSGGAWGTPIQVSGAETTGTPIGGDVTTNGSGDVFGLWPDTGSQKIWLVKSVNGGAAYGAPVKVATTFASFHIAIPAMDSRSALIYTSTGAFRDLTRNLVYASWTDLSGAAGCTTSANAPGASTASTCKTRIWFARSIDGGTTWSSPVMVNNQASLNDQFNQWLTVDPVNGMLGLMYYDTVNDAGRKKTDIWYQSSYDDGVTWNAPFQITTGQTDETAVSADSGNQFGDYNGLSGFSWSFFPSWTDRRGGAKEEVWTAALDEQRTDVWIQDKPWDTGLEPDPATAADNMWESEDIWVRNDLTAGPHQNPIFGRVNYVHAMVRNRSSTITAENVPAMVYYAHASVGLAWPTDWTLIGTASVASLAPGAASEVVVPWSPPGTGHYCLVVRLATAQDPMTHTETSDINYNTRYNNNIAWKNVNVVGMIHATSVPVIFNIRNPSADTGGTFKILFNDTNAVTGGSRFLSRGQITLALGTQLFSRWQSGGAQASGIAVVDSQTIRILNSGAFITVPLNPREAYDVTMTFQNTAGGSTASSSNYIFQVIASNLSTQLPIGGVTYQVQAPAVP